eukprot:TRINITY_DN11356_c0_g1_i1.p1 TRINITY_DN11356_c0_g1~~TRINITY_DN11356_c0_g1_i1.p1  ORF type:complete len:478 (-),score=103.96 TRINITY_DN11356_c0_g1_i1:24-1457(-)
MEMLEGISADIGVPVDQLKVLIWLLASYPLGYFHRFIPGKFLRHAYILVFGLFCVLAVCGIWALVHTLFVSTVAYLLMKYLPRKLVPKSLFFLMFGYLSTYHIYRMLTDYMGWSMDASGPLMVITMKITMLGCNYRDGEKKEDFHEPALVGGAWSKNAVEELPSVLEYFSYILYFPTILTGPGFHYKIYESFIDKSMYHHEKHNPKSEIPSSFVPAVKLFFVAVGCIATNLGVLNFFPTATIFDPEQFDQYSFLYKNFYCYMSLFGTRFRYYFAWKLCEGAAVLNGMGFSGYDEDGNAGWKTLTSVTIRTIETAGNVRYLTTFWNERVAEWLKLYVYFRTTKKGKDRPPASANYITNTASAFWHGFYPGYYITFIYAALTIDVARKIRSSIRPFLVEGRYPNEKVIRPTEKFVYDILAHVFTMGTFTFGMTLFVGLSMENAINYCKSMYFFWPIIVVVGFIVFTFIVPAVVGKKKRE